MRKEVTSRRRCITKLQVCSFVRSISISISIDLHVLLFLVPDCELLEKGGRNEFHEFHESYLRLRLLIFGSRLKAPAIATNQTLQFFFLRVHAINACAFCYYACSCCALMRQIRSPHLISIYLNLYLLRSFPQLREREDAHGMREKSHEVRYRC